MIFSLKRQWIALGTFIAFIVSSLGLPIGHAEPFIQNHSSALKLEINQTVQIPAEIGKIQEVHPSPFSNTVILIQDAHAIPDAQRNIQQLIEFFHEKYGVNQVALEGAASSLDPQIFRSFPDQEKLKEVFNEYYEKGELTGSTAAAIFSKRNDIQFQGVEDWNLYEEGLSLYQKAMAKKEEIEEQLKVKREELRVEKEKIYSKELLETDQALADFQANKVNLIEVLEKLSKFKAPESELALLLHESKKQENVAIDREVKRLAEKVKKYLETVQSTGYRVQRNESSSRGTQYSVLSTFNEKYQEFKTSQITAQEFALWMKESLAESLKKKGTGLSHNLPVRQAGLSPFSTELDQLITNQKRLQDIQGIKLFKDFEVYAQSVKESLFQNEEQRELDARSRELELLEKLAKLELSREEWKEVQGTEYGVQREEEWRNHFAFYENAEKRDEIFFNNLIKVQSTEYSVQSEGNEGLRPPAGRAGSTQYAVRSTILVAGGFHTQGLIERFKAANISYILITPSMNKIPEQTNYQAHMRGEVSWKDYFEVENGKVNLYKAFVRGTRDKLVQSTGYSVQPAGKAGSTQYPVRGTLLKQWRDQILRDLADKNQLTKAHEYTQFIDEISSHAVLGTQSAVRSLWLNNIHQFLDGLQKLDQTHQLTPQNVATLLRSFHYADAFTYNIGSPNAWLSAELLSHSEARKTTAKSRE